MSEEIKESPTGELEQGEFKIKKKRGRPKKLTAKDEPTKLDLSKKEEETKTEDNAIQESRAESGVLRDEQPTVGLQEVGSGVSESVTEEKVQEPDVKQEEEVTVIQEITNEEEPEVKEVIEEPVASPQVELPENVEKLVEFMKDTGGTVEDYVRLNADYSNIDEEALLREYYKQAKPHLDHEEISFLLEDNFAYNPEEDEDRSIRKKKLAYKEEIAKAKNFLEDLKGKYYDEIKLRPGVTQDQQKATDFFNRYNKEQEIVKQQHTKFKTNTKDYFTKDFKGFDFDIGEKKFRYSIKNPDGVADAQSNLTTFVKKFLDEKGNVTDYKGYHKAIYAARNSDTIANHFYEQGKADAIKNMMAKSKNPSTDARTSPPSDVFINGFKVKAISGADSSRLKIKKRKIT